MQKRKQLTWSLITIALIGTYGVLSALYGHVFAKIGIHLPWVHLPLFVGEVVFFSCALIFFFLMEGKHHITRGAARWWALLAFYILSMIALTSQQWFGLSLRNAAMFYYSFFALFIYTAFKICRINEWGLRLLFGVSILVCFFISPDSYFRYSFIVLCAFALLRMKKGRTRLMLLLVMLILAHPQNIFVGARTSLVSSLAAVVFLIAVSVGYLLPLPLRLRLAAFFGCLLLIVMVVWLKADHNGIISLLKPDGLVKQYHVFNSRIAQIKYTPEHIVPKMYNPYAYGTFDVAAGKVDASSPHSLFRPVAYNVVNPAVSSSEINQYSQALTNVDNPGDQYRSLELSYNNMLFRIFIWRDMIREIVEKKAWLGVGFGYPQRSISLETLNWASIEWRRDGWITPHNFFLHLVYRCGIAGVLLIVFLIAWICGKARLFLRARCYEGVLLISALIYWLVAAQILVVLELPYYSIPFWTLLGLTWYTADDLESKAVDFSKGGR